MLLRRAFSIDEMDFTDSLEHSVQRVLEETSSRDKAYSTPRARSSAVCVDGAAGCKRKPNDFGGTFRQALDAADVMVVFGSLSLSKSRRK